MMREIGARVKVSEIIESQLPEFILDNISTVEEIVSSISKTGTYERIGNKVTVTSTSHGLSLNQRLDIEFLSGFGTNGLYTIEQVVDDNTFIISDAVSGTTSGSLNYKIFSQQTQSENVSILNEPASYNKFIEFIKQYYISQEYQSGVNDIVDNLSDYLSLDNLVPEVVISSATLSENIANLDSTIKVNSTKGFPNTYGLLKIDNEIITYTSKDSNTFFGCIRGFSGITNYHDELNYEELIFLSTEASSHVENSVVENLSTLFLKEFLQLIKKTLVPGLENANFTPTLNVGNFLKESKSLYQTKGTEESFKILFKVLFNVDVSIIDLEQFIIKPSSAKYIRRSLAIASEVDGDVLSLIGKQIFKDNDSEVSASITNITPFQRNLKTYYNLFLFIGYDDAESYITGNLNITPSTKSVYQTSINTSPSSIVTVDSTIGFAESGYFLYENNKVYYTEKTINQFLGCYVPSGEIVIEKLGEIISSDLYYGYGDFTQLNKISFRIGGIIGNPYIFYENEYYNFIDGDEITVGGLGVNIFNESNPNKYEKFADSLIYNTCVRYQIKDNSIVGSSFEVLSTPHKSSLKIDDTVEFVDRTSGIEYIIGASQNGNEVTQVKEATIVNIDGNEITVNTDLSLISNTTCDVRRLQKKAQSSSLDIKYGNNTILSNILNLYKDGDYAYLASNSLPSYDFSSFLNEYEINNLSGFDNFTGRYNEIEFSNTVSFLDGDLVKYTYTGDKIDGIDENEFYYVKVLEGKTRIKLYLSKSFVINDIQSITFGEFPSGSGEHKISLYSQRNSEVNSQKLLKKFLINDEFALGEPVETSVGSVGLMVNGVEISGYKTSDKIYYGPVKSVEVISGGTGYDVINPPLLEFEYGNAKIQPVVVGSFDKILVSPQEFAVLDTSSDIVVEVSGGNGSGALLKPIITRYQKEIEFDAREVQFGGNLNIDTEIINFNSPHGLYNGQEIIYDSNNNLELGINAYQGSNNDSGESLVNNSVYYANVLSDNEIKIHKTDEDRKLGINTVGFSTVGTSGLHIFRTKNIPIITDISVIEPGSRYSNKKLGISTSSISTKNYTFSFENHGFLDGELVNYSVGESSSPITGISTDNSYYILKIDDNTFRISDAGIGGTVFTNYQRRKFVTFEDVGVGYQIFNYPEIKLSVLYSTPGESNLQSLPAINATPIVRGSIEGVYVYDGGIGYGTSIINLNNQPKIIIKSGKDAQLEPIIINGKIIDVQILSGGSEYYSTPDIFIESSSGIGAILKPIIENNSISSVQILNSGVGYLSDTKLIVKNSGKNAKFDTLIRPLTINKNYRYGKYESKGNNEFYRKISDEILDYTFGDEQLTYMVTSLSKSLMNKMSNEYGENFTDSNFHSPIIGWAYDGVPIYGPYGFSDPENSNSQIKLIKSGYIKSANLVPDRPSVDNFEEGFFTEDYVYNNSGDLDEYNGRFCKTPEFPNGIYAYFATIEEDSNIPGELIGKFPYFIGKYYKKYFDEPDFNYTNLNFDFNNSNLIRNTHPYKSNDKYAGSDTLTESNEFIKQFATVNSVYDGEILNYEIVNSGTNYKVGDRVLFKDESDLIIKVSKISGKDILSISNNIESYSNAIILPASKDKIIVKILPYHSLENGDIISFSGLSTDLSYLTNYYKVEEVQNLSSSLSTSLGDYSSTGIVTSVNLNFIPQNISVGSSIQIDTEIYKILEVNNLSLKIERTTSSPSHNENSLVYFLPNTLSVYGQNVEDFYSKNNDIVYFSPNESVGFGTTSGITVPITKEIDGTVYYKEVPTQSIYIPNHPFKENQKIILRKYGNSISIGVKYTKDGPTVNLPVSGNSQELYVINKSKDYIGLSTNIESISSENGIYFYEYVGGNYDIFGLETIFEQKTCQVIKSVGIITTKEPHELVLGDSISVNVIPKNNVGLGSISNIVKYDPNENLILFNEINIGTNVDTLNNSITINSHNYETGDAVYYKSSNGVASGLSTGRYFVYKVGNNTIKLCETYIDATSPSPLTLEINSSGGSGQTLSKINPKITSIIGNDIIFDLNDPSLNEFDFKIYYDQQFKKEFISYEGSESFSVGVGNSIKIIKYSDNLPKILYYNLEKEGNLNYSEYINPDSYKIEFSNSLFNGSYQIFGVGSTTFSFPLRREPEVSKYNFEDCVDISYTSSSKSASGPISQISSYVYKNNLKNIPIFDIVSSEGGSGASIVAKSDTIGRLKTVNILNNGYDYPSDPTLRPTAFSPSVVNLEKSYEIVDVSIINGANNYITEPNVVVLDPVTLDVVDSGLIKANVSDGVLESLDVIVPPKGLNEKPSIIKTINNSNGIYLNSVIYSSTGIVTCTLQTPVLGFDIEPFSEGDRIFVENIRKESSDGDGFNSTDHGFVFFEITSYDGFSNPRKLEFNISQFTENPGIPIENQLGYASVVKEENYPSFSSTQIPSSFLKNELILVNNNEVDLYVNKSEFTTLRLSGSYKLVEGDIITGKESGSVGTVNNVSIVDGIFDIVPYTNKIYGWLSNTGVLNQFSQVIEDNNYYQNLSYSIKSEKTWNEISSQVNSMLHTSGLKNFSDTEIVSSISSGIKTATDSVIDIINYYVSDLRVDTINNFDLSIDIDILN